MNKERITLFDSMKGIAILAIMFIHLGQWNLKFADGSRAAIIRSAGLLGVEITYIINAYFYTKRYMEQKFSYRIVVKMFANLIPVYYFGLIVYGISTYYAFGAIDETGINILSHFLFLNGLNPEWWAGYMGGTGYFGILAICWMLFPIYLRSITDLRTSITNGSILIAICYIFTQGMKFVNNLIRFNASINFTDWLWYLNRGGIVLR